MPARPSRAMGARTPPSSTGSSRSTRARRRHMPRTALCSGSCDPDSVTSCADAGTDWRHPSVPRRARRGSADGGDVRQSRCNGTDGASCTSGADCAPGFECTGTGTCRALLLQQRSLRQDDEGHERLRDVLLRRRERARERGRNRAGVQPRRSLRAVQRHVQRRRGVHDRRGEQRQRPRRDVRRCRHADSSATAASKRTAPRASRASGRSACARASSSAIRSTPARRTRARAA